MGGGAKTSSFRFNKKKRSRRKSRKKKSMRRSKKQRRSRSKKKNIRKSGKKRSRRYKSRKFRMNKKSKVSDVSDKIIFEKLIKILVRQASRWSTAAKQDKNSMIAVLHANYGAAYLWALKDIASSEQIKLATGIDVLKFEREIVNTQDQVTTRMAELCPKYAPELSYLSSIGKES